jgi:hypothetical protein
VAALGLSLRTVAQLLEQGQLDEIVGAHRAQAGSRPEGGRSEGRREPRGGGARAAVASALPATPAPIPSPVPASPLLLLRHLPKKPLPRSRRQRLLSARS